MGSKDCNPSCCPQAPRPTCRPQPSLFSKLNCVACNRLLFFVIGAAAMTMFERMREAARNEANKDPKQREQERKDREKRDKLAKLESDKKEKERLAKLRKDELEKAKRKP